MATRPQVEDVLVLEFGGLLKATRLATDPDADTSPRAYLRGPLAAAIRGLGITPANPAQPTDLEVQQGADLDLDQLLDRARLAILQRAVLSPYLINEQAGQDRQDKASLVKEVRAELDAIRQRVHTLYPDDEPTGPSGGGIVLGFETTWDAG